MTDKTSKGKSDLNFFEFKEGNKTDKSNYARQIYLTSNQNQTGNHKRIIIPSTHP